MMRGRGQAGFTLVELLVSLAVLGMVAAMLFSGVALARAIVTRAASERLDDEAIVTAQTLLRDRIESIVPSLRADFDRPIVDLRGTPALFSFFAPAPPADRPTTVRRYRLLRTPAGQIVLYASPDLSSRVNPYAPGEVGWMPTVLLTGVAALRIDYFGAVPGDGQRHWRPQWTDQFAPPELVRVRLDFASDDRREWPDLIVRPAAQVNIACKIAAESGRCTGT